MYLQAVAPPQQKSWGGGRSHVFSLLKQEKLNFFAHLGGIFPLLLKSWEPLLTRGAFEFSRGAINIFYILVAQNKTLLVTGLVRRDIKEKEQILIN